LAVKAGLRGLVCSPLEITTLRQFGLNQFNWSHLVSAPEMKRRMIKSVRSPQEAMDAGANWLVIGRPIALRKPRNAAEKSSIRSIAAEGSTNVAYLCRVPQRGIRQVGINSCAT
jgi:orotidine-5'-phosphate decarboxylase